MASRIFGDDALGAQLLHAGAQRLRDHGASLRAVEWLVRRIRVPLVAGHLRAGLVRAALVVGDDVAEFAQRLEERPPRAHQRADPGAARPAGDIDDRVSRFRGGRRKAEIAQRDLS
jgi:hypothetical protein